MHISFRNYISVIVFLAPVLFAISCGTPGVDIPFTDIPKAKETQTLGETKRKIISDLAVERGFDKCPGEDASPESLILTELEGTWIADDGSRFKLTSAKILVLTKLLMPVAKRQYELSYAGASTRAEEEANGKTLIVFVNETSGQRTVTWTKKPGTGEEKLQQAAENIGLQSKAIDIDGTDLSDERNVNSGVTARIKNGYLTVSAILRKADRAGQCRAYHEPTKEL